MTAPYKKYASNDKLCTYSRFNEILFIETDAVGLRTYNYFEIYANDSLVKFIALQKMQAHAFNEYIRHIGQYNRWGD